MKELNPLGNLSARQPIAAAALHQTAPTTCRMRAAISYCNPAAVR